MTTERYLVSLLALCLYCASFAALAQSGPHLAVSTSNVRSEPSINSKVVTVISAGQAVEVTAVVKSGAWYAITLGDGRSGYIYSKLLKPADGRAAASTAQTSASASASASGGRSASPQGAGAYFITPFPGETIPGGRFWVRFGLTKMGVAPAGVEKQYTGHHHLLINADMPPLDEPIPSDDNYVHFGRGQTEHFVELPPGEHTLQLLLGDHEHVPHDPPVSSEKITVIVP